MWKEFKGSLCWLLIVVTTLSTPLAYAAENNLSPSSTPTFWSELKAWLFAKPQLIETEPPTVDAEFETTPVTEEKESEYVTQIKIGEAQGALDKVIPTFEYLMPLALITVPIGVIVMGLGVIIPIGAHRLDNLRLKTILESLGLISAGAGLVFFFGNNIYQKLKTAKTLQQSTYAGLTLPEAWKRISNLVESARKREKMKEKGIVPDPLPSDQLLKEHQLFQYRPTGADTSRERSDPNHYSNNGHYVVTSSYFLERIPRSLEDKNNPLLEFINMIFPQPYQPAFTWETLWKSYLKLIQNTSTTEEIPLDVSEAQRLAFQKTQNMIPGLKQSSITEVKSDIDGGNVYKESLRRFWNSDATAKVKGLDPQDLNEWKVASLQDLSAKKRHALFQWLHAVYIKSDLGTDDMTKDLHDAVSSNHRVIQVGKKDDSPRAPPKISLWERVKNYWLLRNLFPGEPRYNFLPSRLKLSPPSTFSDQEDFIQVPDSFPIQEYGFTSRLVSAERLLQSAMAKFRVEDPELAAKTLLLADAWNSFTDQERFLKSQESNILEDSKRLKDIQYALLNKSDLTLSNFYLANSLVPRSRSFNAALSAARGPDFWDNKERVPPNPKKPGFLSKYLFGNNPWKRLHDRFSHWSRLGKIMPATGLTIAILILAFPPLKDRGFFSEWSLPFQSLKLFQNPSPVLATDSLQKAKNGGNKKEDPSLVIKNPSVTVSMNKSPQALNFVTLRSEQMDRARPITISHDVPITSNLIAMKIIHYSPRNNRIPIPTPDGHTISSIKQEIKDSNPNAESEDWILLQDPVSKSYALEFLSETSATILVNFVPESSLPTTDFKLSSKKLGNEIKALRESGAISLPNAFESLNSEGPIHVSELAETASHNTYYCSDNEHWIPSMKARGPYTTSSRFIGEDGNGNYFFECDGSNELGEQFLDRTLPEGVSSEPLYSVVLEPNTHIDNNTYALDLGGNLHQRTLVFGNDQFQIVDFTPYQKSNFPETQLPLPDEPLDKPPSRLSVLDIQKNEEEERFLADARNDSDSDLNNNDSIVNDNELALDEREIISNAKLREALKNLKSFSKALTEVPGFSSVYGKVRLGMTPPTQTLHLARWVGNYAEGLVDFERLKTEFKNLFPSIEVKNENPAEYISEFIKLVKERFEQDLTELKKAQDENSRSGKPQIFSLARAVLLNTTLREPMMTLLDHLQNTKWAPIKNDCASNLTKLPLHHPKNQ